jgi:hypothetical protein
MIKSLRVPFVLGMLLAAVLVFGTFTYAPAVPSASAHSFSPAVTCYGQAVYSPSSSSVWTLGVGTYAMTPWYTTTSYCNDINIYPTVLTHPIQMQVCFYSTNQCNSWKTVSSLNQWYVIASSVLDGTTYRFGVRTTVSTNLQYLVAS